MTQERPALRLLHTSDLHLGDDIDPNRRLASLVAVVDTALAHRVDAVLIAGDFFDSARVRDEAIRPVIEQLSRLSMPAVIIPGNHDCVDDNSVYRRVNLRDAGDHIHFVHDPAGAHVIFDDMRLAIWARGIEDHHPGHHPLEGYRPGGDPGYWRVVLTHGHFVPSDEESYRSSPIREHEIADLQCDYVALGHWHRFLDLTAEGPPTFYSGSPSEAGGTFASVNLVVLDPVSGVHVERLPI